MRLNEISDLDGAKKKRKRVGRGSGSGLGKTGGRGVKGQKSRSGVAIKGFEGGQMPIYRRLPKRGFNSYRPTIYSIVNVGDIQKAIDSGRLDSKNKITAEIMIKAGLVRKVKYPVRLLAKGDLAAAINIEVAAASANAIAAIEKNGGKVLSLGQETSKS